MPFFRPASRALSHFLRHEPSVHLSSPASLFSRHSPLAPFARAFDHPFFSSPLYTVYEAREDDSGSSSSSSSSNNQQGRIFIMESKKPEEAKAAEPQKQQQQSNEDRLAQRHEDNHRQRWLDRRAHRRARHHHHHHHQHPLSLFSPFNSLLGSPFFAQSSFQPLEISVDLYSTPTAYQINAAIPGVKKEDIKLTVEDGVLSIEAERREERDRPFRSAAAAAPTSASTGNSTTASSTTSSTASSSSATSAEAVQTEQKPVEVEVKANGVETNNVAETKAQQEPQQQQQQQHEEEDDEVSVHHVESHYGRVQRSFQLPEDVNVEGLSARYEDGVLKIELPRIEEKKQQVKQINIQ